MRDFRNLPNTPEQDNGGVHINSGIPNRAAALVIQALGHDVTEQIYYRGLSMYLTRNSQFGDARNGLIQAAEDLHGAGSAQANAVAEAFDAVGVTGETNTTDPTENDVPSVTGGNRSIVAFIVANGSAANVPDGAIAFYDPFSQEANGFLGVFSDPGAIARLGSQLTTTTDGSSIWFINADGFLSAIDLVNVDDSTPDSFAAAPVLTTQDIFIQEPGDLFNAAVGPIGVDETDAIVEYVALTSAYDNDPTLYFTDLSEVYSIEITPSTSAQGVSNNLVRYPDVVSWSPNPYQPKVAFDALNSIPTIGSSSDYWTIFELDFNAGAMYNLIPAQPVEISVGNVTYSNTNPDIVAFNVVETNELGESVFDIYMADFESGSLAPLELPSITDDFGSPVLPDAERPTFAPDDSYLAFGSASLSSLIFMDSESGELTQVELVVPPFNPHWFIVNADVSDVVATSTEDDVEVPETTTLLGSYPNPFSGSSTIAYNLTESSRVSLEVFDALGRSASTLIDEWRPAGRHELRFTADGLTPGMYLARLKVGDRVFTHKMLLTR
jgi:hypothetical protein